MQRTSVSTTFGINAYYPPWVGIVPEELVSDSTKAFGIFSSINMMLRRYSGPGTYPTTFVESGLQWGCSKYLATASIYRTLGPASSPFQRTEWCDPTTTVW